jgi:SET domain-containing protein
MIAGINIKSVGGKKGKGVFATKNFKKGAAILKWKPKVLNAVNVKNLSKKQKHFIFKTSKTKFLLMRAPEKYVNHSCSPNTKATHNADVAIKNIKKGEEITSDYGKSGVIKFQCSCGSKNCRGTI